MDTSKDNNAKTIEETTQCLQKTPWFDIDRYQHGAMRQIADSIIRGSAIAELLL